MLDDDHRPRAGDFFVDGVQVEIPGGVNLAVDAADRALVAKAHPLRDLLVAHALGQHQGHLPFIWFQQVKRRIFIFMAHFLHARFDVGIDIAAAVRRRLAARAGPSAAGESSICAHKRNG